MIALKDIPRILSDKIPPFLIHIGALLIVVFSFIFLIIVSSVNQYSIGFTKQIETEIFLAFGLFLFVLFIFLVATILYDFKPTRRPYPTPFDYHNANTLAKRTGIPISDLKKVYNFTGTNITLSDGGGALSFTGLVNNTELRCAGVLPLYFSSFAPWTLLSVNSEDGLPTSDARRILCSFTYILRNDSDTKL